MEPHVVPVAPNAEEANLSTLSASFAGDCARASYPCFPCQRSSSRAFRGCVEPAGLPSASACLCCPFGSSCRFSGSQRLLRCSAVFRAGQKPSNLPSYILAPVKLASLCWRSCLTVVDIH